MRLSLKQFRSFQPRKNTYARFVWKNGQGIIPELHASLFRASGQRAEYYEIVVPPWSLKEALRLAKKNLQGISLGRPHNRTVIPLLDEVDSEALKLGVVNTVVFKKGKSAGYNTEILGFAECLRQEGVKLADAKVLLLCGGDSAPAMAYHCAREGAQLTLTDHRGGRAAELQKRICEAVPGAQVSVFNSRHIPGDIQIVLNSTMVGMFSKGQNPPLHLLPQQAAYVLEAAYNPPLNAAIKNVRAHCARASDGMKMLVMKEAHTHRLWSGARIEPSVCKTITRSMYGKQAVLRLHKDHGKENIVLCGFMGSGKTTIGRKLARITGLTFYDSDQYIEACEGEKIIDIFNEKGEGYFRELEAKYVRELAKKRGIVLSLGGGSVLMPENVEAVRESGLLIYLDTPYHRIVQNLSHSYKRPLLEDSSTKTRKLYNSRKTIYQRVADCSVRSARISDVLENVVKSI